MDWVVRAGEARAAFLINGYVRHQGVPGSLYGFSVQYAPGLGMSVEDLARAGQFPNGQISYAHDSDLLTALTPLGYRMRLIASPGRGFHHTFAVLYNANGVMLTTLPQDAADALDRVFQRRPNPHRKPLP